MSARLAVTLTAAVALSFAVDAIAVPRAPLRRPLLSSVLHILAVLFVFDLVFAVTSRSLFSACAALALVGLVAAVSNAKYESLREPFVFTDLSLFSQLFSHPRLYLPFLSVGKVVAIGAGIVLVIAGFVVERPVLAGSRVLVWFTVGVSFMLAVLVAARVPLTLDPDADQRRHGFFAVFVAYLLNGLRPATFRRFREVMAAGPFTTGQPTQRPDVIVIQSESFFDARRLGEVVEPGLFRRFDEARREAVWHGEMTVPAWGANTMRTEFAVLTGTESFSLGYARFYPYAFVRNKIASLASWFNRCGYDTVAIHPYYADFFGRNRVFPLLGFTRFLDIRHFASASRAGPYVADAAVSESIIAELDAAGGGRPRFVFAMTMENHGPLHLEQVLPGESSSRHTLGEDASWRDLTAYLRHVENADAMIGRLIDYLRTSNRETIVCFYGDHVPALPRVFHKLGVTPQRSDYFIWRNYGAVGASCRDLSAEELGAVLLRVVQEDGHRAEGPCASEKAT
ncbi:MAG: LTA synthase family protein [Burkholderia sp.]|uniref:LTA synthase family protein n=2 Tax=Burkholderia sp. TaxID=36773 RepID=UPI0025867EBE|nr:LTA synthase family protein [Burkholderia sp.]MCA3777362.1 LTA synthase family protein [Burkholderia sp.]MCA3784349.1 LTA synthase family protein [Burkholderia sp.]MCA3794742.1 LTA synthase family protein [Burkholderia sp.]MCA3813803.1 LTA synthase family protein [Burkholderia sp.]MCA3816096.1 LTA synthase family protein [Burkholderia sp.]